MKKLLPIALLFVIAACDSQTAQTSTEVATAASLDSHSQRISYLMGLDNGKNIRGIGLEIDAEAFNQGFTDGLDEKPPVLTEEQIAEVTAVGSHAIWPLLVSARHVLTDGLWCRGENPVENWDDMKKKLYTTGDEDGKKQATAKL